MRRLTALTLLLLLAFADAAPAAPAPLPRRSRRSSEADRQKLLAQRVQQLKELGVTWRLGDYEGRPVVLFQVSAPGGNRGMGGGCTIRDGDLSGALGRVIQTVQRFLRAPDRL